MAKSTIKSYEDMRGHLDQYYSDFIKDPESFGVDTQIAHEIQNANILQKKGLWVLFKQQFKLKLEQLEKHDLAELLTQDLAEDGVNVVSKKTLDLILKHPENPDYHLESEMIEVIKNMNTSEKEALMNATAPLLHIDLLADKSNVNQKILQFVKSLWEKIAPVLDKIFDTLLDHGIHKLEEVMGTKLPSDLKETIETTITDVGHTVTKSTLTTVDQVINDGLTGNNPLDTLKNAAKNLGTEVGNTVGSATNKIVDNETNHVMNLVTNQIEHAVDAVGVSHTGEHHE